MSKLTAEEAKVRAQRQEALLKNTKCLALVKALGAFEDLYIQKKAQVKKLFGTKDGSGLKLVINKDSLGSIHEFLNLVLQLTCIAANIKTTALLLRQEDSAAVDLDEFDGAVEDRDKEIKNFEDIKESIYKELASLVRENI